MRLKIRCAEMSCIFCVKEGPPGDVRVKIMAASLRQRLATIWAAFQRYRQEVREAREYQSKVPIPTAQFLTVM